MVVSYGKEKGQEQNMAFQHPGRPQRDAKREVAEAVCYVYIILMELLTLIRGNIFEVVRNTYGVEK